MAMNFDDVDLDNVEDDFDFLSFLLDSPPGPNNYPGDILNIVGGEKFVNEVSEMGMYPEECESDIPLLAPNEKGTKEQVEGLQKVEIAQEMEIGGEVNRVNEIAKRRTYHEIEPSERECKIPTLLPREEKEALQKIETEQEKEIGKEMEIGQEIEIGKEKEVGQKTVGGQEMEIDHGQHFCKICKTMMKSAESLQAHLVERHSIKMNHIIDNTTSGGGVFTLGTNICKHCQTGFTLKTDFLAHTSLRTKIKCIFCPKDFSCEGAWEKHMNVHLENVKLFHCSICSKEISSRHSLKKHYATHVANKKFVCPICKVGNEVTYRTRRCITAHLKSHSANQLSSV